MPRYLWTQRQDIGPSARRGAAVAFDDARGRTVLFGGISSAEFGDTWEWDGELWTQIADTGPAPRAMSSLTFDVARGRFVLFGGASNSVTGTVNMSDTWELVDAEWTQVGDSGPAARSQHSVSYDPQRERHVLFGGLDDDGAPLAGTWEFDGIDWTEVDDMGPARGSAAMAFDRASGDTILFGGFDGTNALGDTWGWNGSSWRQVADFGPSPRRAFALAAGAAALFLHGGAGLNPFTPHGDTWRWAGSRWTQVQDIGPSNRYVHAHAYDSARNRLVLFGGFTQSDRNLNDTWEMPIP